jgi:hypothetical protein
MPTRSRLRSLRPDRDDATGVTQVYKHSGSYPPAVVHLLVELATLLQETETLRGPNYTAA